MPKLTISSPSNQTVKDLVKLKERKGERSEKCFLVEGAREIERAITQGFKAQDFFVCSDLLSIKYQSLIESIGVHEITYITPEVFSRVATRGNSDGLLAVFSRRDYSLNDVLRRANSENLLILVLENLEKPGNLGAVLRSADGAGVHGVIVLGSRVDIWNPNAIRSSLGGVFSVPVVHCEYDDFFSFCKERNVKTVAAVLTSEAKTIFSVDLTSPTAILFGSEAHGLSEIVLKKCNCNAMIPMQGLCDSLNVSVAAGVFMYEALRQRLQ